MLWANVNCHAHILQILRLVIPLSISQGLVSHCVWYIGGDSRT